MAEALVTKKRRLFKLLDNLSSSDLPSKSPSSATISTTSTKRSLTATERFEEARERASKRLRHSTSTGSLSSLQQQPTSRPVAHSKSIFVPGGTRKDGVADSDEYKGTAPPNFSPWSHEMFLQRLKTFASVSLWHPKPEGISEVEWAKRGWRCVDVNIVACKGGCERRVVVSMDAPARKKGTQEEEEDGENEDEDEDEDEQEAFERALVERYKSVIADGHAEHCMWRSSGCRDDVYRLQVIRPSVWQPELRKRCHSLLAICPSIERVTFRPMDTDGVKIQPAERLIKDLPADLVGLDDPANDGVKATRALTIALHGWRGAKEAGTDLLHCDACFQRIGLWMYQPGYKRPAHHSPDPNNVDGEEGEEDESVPIIDLTTLHREHCPYRNASTQKSSGSLAGMNAIQILQRVVATYARDHRRRSAEQQQHRPDSNGQDALGEGEAEDDEDRPVTPKASKEEVAKADKEREGRLRRLKSLFSVRRKGGKTAPVAAGTGK